MRGGWQRTTRRWQACLAGLIAWLFAGASLAGFVHRAQVEHEVCAEHGEVIHAAPRRDVTDDTSVASGTSAGGRAPTQQHEHDREHEHCELGPLRHASYDTPACEVTDRIEDPDIRLVLRTPSADALLPITLDHRRAPKTSPPTAG